MTNCTIKNNWKLDYEIIWDNGKWELDHKIHSSLIPKVIVYGNLVATRKLPTKNILKKIDSSVRNLGEVEYDK